MLGIFDAIKGFFEFIVSIVEFLFGLIKDLVYVVRMIGKAAISIPTYIGFLPTVLISLFLVSVSVVIIYKIVGRD